MLMHFHLISLSASRGSNRVFPSPLHDWFVHWKKVMKKKINNYNNEEADMQHSRWNRSNFQYFLKISMHAKLNKQIFEYIYSTWKWENAQWLAWFFTHTHISNEDDKQSKKISSYSIEFDWSRLSLRLVVIEMNHINVRNISFIRFVSIRINSTKRLNSNTIRTKSKNNFQLKPFGQHEVLYCFSDNLWCCQFLWGRK